MPDLLAGTVITALDTPPTVSNQQAGLFTFNATTYGIDADAGTYVDCGVAFVAPTTGRVLISYGAGMDNDTAAQLTILAPVVRAGSTVGAGTVVLAASDNNAVYMTGTAESSHSRTILLTGLTPGSSYNVRLEHHVSGGIGQLSLRNVTVAPGT